MYGIALSNTFEDEYKTDNKKFVEWFAKDKEKLVNDIQRMRDNTYFRKASLASGIKFRSGAVTFCIPAEYNGQKSKNGAESCLRDDEAEARAAQGIFCTTNTFLGQN